MAERLPTIQEVQQLVDDPKIDDDTKRTLLVRYFDAIDNVDPVVYGFQNKNEKQELLKSFADRFGFAERDLKDGHLAYDAYSRAQGRHDANMNALREEQQRAVEDGKARLDSLKGSETSPGARNSNEILDTGVPGLDCFRTWLPVYGAARAVAAPGLPDFRLQELIDRYDEQRDIPFDKFTAGAGEIVQVRESVADAAPAQNSAVQSLFGQWDGDGKNAAAASWAKFGDGVKVVEQALDHAADVINRTIAAIAGSCRDKASWVLQHSFQSWPQQQGLTAQDTDRLARIAQLGRNASADDFKHFIPFLAGQQSPLAAQLVSSAYFGLSDELLDAVQSWAKSWLAEFCGWFAGLMGEFQAMCENTRVAVASQWAALNAELQKVPDNPFSGVGEAVPPRSGGGSGQDSHGPGSAKGNGGGAAGGGAGGGGAGAPPVVPPVAAPSAVPAAAVPPVIPPVTAPAADDLDTLTVQRGDSTLEMTEPDRTGRMNIKIDSGPGAAKDYQLDWGAADPARPAYTPGADGKIHVDDGALHITAERPGGETGPTVVTVDDGTAAPTTYTLGEKPDPAAGPADTRGGRLTEAAYRAGQGGAVSGGTGQPALGIGGAHAVSAAGAFPAVDGAAGTVDAGGVADRVGAWGAAGGAFDVPGGVGAWDAGGAAGPGGGGPDDVPGRAGAAGAGDPGIGAAGGGGAGDSYDVPGPVGARRAAGAADSGDGATGGAGGAAGAGGVAAADAGGEAAASPPGPSPAGSGGPGAPPDSVAAAAGPAPTGHGLGGGSDRTAPVHELGGVADGIPAGGGLGHAGSLSHSTAPAESGATLGAAPGLDPVGSGVPGDPSAMSMLGGLPAAGGNQDSDDHERTSRAYRIDGGIFDTAHSGGRISGSLDDEESRR
ncbi:WXG100 family type VII secretion target [Amycolatopsis granulosa]|uniref:WXG100 family type VII secretion target n=1 Tax=Amycolatopsis granulosa TaxID=185684 RepID=UPI001424708C|nr:hypothetical protein [Amycolatopsis granulosa]NIH85630.1 hypothetical protein [Amycolatopsis granulosa]